MPIDTSVKEFIEIPREEKHTDFDQEGPISDYLKPEDKQKASVASIKSAIESAMLDRHDYETRLTDYQNQWRGIPEDKSMPWANCSNTHAMKTYSTVQIISSRLSAILLETDPLVSFLANNNTEDGVKKARLQEQVFQFIMDQKINYFPKLSMAIRNMCRDGDVFIKTQWKLIERKTRETEEVAEVDLLVNEDGEPVVGPTGNTTFETFERTRTVWNWPDLEVISPIDIIRPSNAKGVQSEESDFICHRLKLTIDQLKRRAMAGVYQNVDKIKPQGSQGDNLNDLTGGKDLLLENMRENEGTTDNRTSPSDDKLIEIWEVWLLFDIDGDGLEEECVFTIVPHQNILLRAEPNPFKHGMRPFVQLRFEPVEDRPYSIGLAELIQPSEDLINSFRNLRIDLLSLAAAPVLLVRQRLFGKLKNRTLRPGDLLPVEDPTDISVLVMPPPTPALFQEELIISNTIDEISGAIGSVRGFEQVNRPTARGTISLLAQALERFKPLISRNQKELERLYTQIFSNMQQFMPREVYIQVAGEEGQKLQEPITRDQIQGQFTISISATSGNRQVQRENEMLFTNLLFQLSNISLEQQAAQTGVNIRRAIIMLGKNLGIKNVNEFIMTQEETNQLIEQQIRLTESRAALAQAQLQLQAGGPVQGVVNNVPVNPQEINQRTAFGDEFRALAG